MSKHSEEDILNLNLKAGIAFTLVSIGILLALFLLSKESTLIL